MSRPPKYGLEFSLNKLIKNTGKDIRELMIAMKNFFFKTPKDREELFIYLMSVIPWLIFIWGIFSLMGR